MRLSEEEPLLSPDELWDVLDELERVNDHHDDIALLAVNLARGRTRRSLASAPQVTSVELGPAWEAPAAARRFVAGGLSLRGLDSVVDVVVLLVSELVTNAVRHSGGPLRLQLSVDPDMVRVDVSDGVPDPPRPQPADDVAERGRGLMIVGALADRWGVETLPAGKRVWFELDREG